MKESVNLFEATKRKWGKMMWMIKRPTHWRHLIYRMLRPLRKNFDSEGLRAEARLWAQRHVSTIDEALQIVGLLKGNSEDIPRLPEALIEKAEGRVSSAHCELGGAGDIKLLYAATVLSSAERAVETGVAYGWSSLAMLAAFEKIGKGHLVSVDMTYPERNAEDLVGIAVPDSFQDNWTLIREPDRNGLLKAIAFFDGQIDICHYDSEKAWWGRHFAFPILFRALRSNGIFICDDIEDNLYFAQFVEKRRLPFAVTEFSGKFVGICRKL